MKLWKIMIATFGFAFFLLSAILLFEPTNGPTGFFVYTPTLAIVNNENNAGLDDNLAIEFMTKGINDLTVSFPEEGADFLELRCDGNKLQPVLENNEIVYRDYNCKKTGFLEVKVLSHETVIRFKFGNDVQEARNTVS